MLSNVYFVPNLTSNIISFGQLDESRCKIVVEEGLLSILDHGRNVIA